MYEDIEFENKYVEFLGNVEKSFGKTQITGDSMLQRLYCGTRFVEGSARALKIFRMLDGKNLLDEVGKQHLISWLEELINDLKQS